MLTYNEVLTRAITWTVIAENAVHIGNVNSAGAYYCKAHAYTAVLDLPYHKCCGVKCTENLKQYGTALAKQYHKLGDNPTLTINEFLRDNLDLNFWDSLK